LKWAELFQPAIRLCESGVPVPQIIGYYIARNLTAFVRAGSGVEENIKGSSQSMGEDLPGLGPIGVLRLEAGVPESTRRSLIQLGWPMGTSDGGFGRYECIEHRMSGSDRVYAAASEMRADGTALAY
jgi:gamma-glutamyltranspeptidase / glutathione hydrolase